MLPSAAVGGERLKPVDRFLRYWRIYEVRRFIPRGSRVLDIGCFDGAMFRILGRRISSGVGVDQALIRSVDQGSFQFLKGTFPLTLPSQEPFDAITLLAVLEHVEEDSVPDLRRGCVDVLAPGGVVLITVPSPAVDRILTVLRRFHLVSGIALHQHHGFQPERVPSLFADPRLRLTVARTFQFGLNHLFVLTKTGQD